MEAESKGCQCSSTDATAAGFIVGDRVGWGKGQARFRKKMTRERNSGHNVRDRWEGNQRASKGPRQYVALKITV